ncbi:MAG: adenosylcobinamide-GDP ribazoletransferase [Lachnospiraceae bacterium]|nr:adenosylcobinamide-GDP ribazoletransferase [Lachnospiraceae bacterium]
MRIIRCLIIAFSLYSRIPMPRFTWKDEDMKYVLCFLPFVGAVIGGLVYGALFLADMCKLPLLAKVCIVSVIPLLITGGFHADGYMDVKDALSSYKPREDKLAILKDPHIGAFAVIGFVIYALIWTAAVAVICDRSVINSCVILIPVFILSRIGTSISSVALKKAKSDGMLNNEAKGAGRIQIAVMIIELAVTLTIACLMDIYIAVTLAAVLAIVYVYYGYKTYKEFGGVTGDTAGYFVCISELAQLIVIAVCNLIRTL